MQAKCYLSQNKFSNFFFVCRCTLPSGKEIVMVTVYISVNQNVGDIIDFFHEALLIYTERESKLMIKRHHELPLILCGDFSTDFD